MKQCRIAVTTKCNLSCDYCIMQKREVLDTFKKAKLEDILKNDYSAFLITGGEPTCEPKLWQTLIEIRFRNVGKPIYLYTNGVQIGNLTGFIMDYPRVLDGINIGVHQDEITHYDWRKYRTLNMLLPVRLHRWEKLINDGFVYGCQKWGFDYKAWKMDECDTKEEDRFILVS